ncbi:MAG: hypothetical protein WBD20_18905 [Pirellulaceae bacterium]
MAVIQFILFLRRQQKRRSHEEMQFALHEHGIQFTHWSKAKGLQFENLLFDDIFDIQVGYRSVSMDHPEINMLIYSVDVLQCAEQLLTIQRNDGTRLEIDQPALHFVWADVAKIAMACNLHRGSVS